MNGTKQSLSLCGLKAESVAISMAHVLHGYRPFQMITVFEVDNVPKKVVRFEMT